MVEICRSYLKKLWEIYRRGDATEPSYYPALKEFLENYAHALGKSIEVTVQPKKTEIGMPDFRLRSKDKKIIGYIEAKIPFDKNLEHIATTEQLQRYRESLPNIILTNFFEFYLFRNDKPRDKIRIANPFTLIQLKGLPSPENLDKFTQLMEKFFSFSIPETYRAEALATELANRTRLLKTLVLEELQHGQEKILGFYKAFKDELIESLTEKQFADMYAQTITYGLFSARIQTRQGDFSQFSAYELIPKRMELLRDLFYSLIGPGFPDSLKWITDDIKNILAHTKIQPLEESLFKEWEGDLIIHFYETFLKVSNPKERKHRGVYYTPLPVVSYIIRSIHKLLKSRFSKADGLADRSVTLLDPAAGTLTFPITAIRIVKDELERKGKQGIFSSIVKEHIIPHFYAFELLIPPYAIGHFRVAGVLEDLGYRLGSKERFHFYLTNSLETKEVKELPIMPDLAKEGREAKEIKEKIPILVVCGNPPYSVSSENRSPFIERLMEDYKKDVRGEKNIQPLSDDYIKFIRFAQWKIEQAGQGIIGMITNNAYLSGLIHRGMRKKLLDAFDDIYILNLHGSERIGEKAPDGSKDENVFDIRQGVAIALFVRHSMKDSQPKMKNLYYADLYGLEKEKSRKLSEMDIENTKWRKLKPKEPFYFFVPKEFKGERKYKKFWGVKDIFGLGKQGFKTHQDKKIISWDKSNAKGKVIALIGTTSEIDIKNIQECIYRPFDERWLYFDKSVVKVPRMEVMGHFLKNANIGLAVGRAGQVVKIKFSWDLCLVVNKITDLNVFYRGGAYIFPLYLYNQNNDLPNQQQQLYIRDASQERKVNFRPEFLQAIQKSYSKIPAPEEIFYYIYGILYSNIYRKKYEEFLKIDFPRVPLTSDYKLFEKISKLGEQLVKLHLLKSPLFSASKAGYPITGTDKVEKRVYKEKEKKVFINNKQYFNNIPKEVWEYHIGGYQVLDRWLKDRKSRSLTGYEIEHYLKVITALKYTIKLQQKIDKIYSEIDKRA